MGFKCALCNAESSGKTLGVGALTVGEGWLVTEFRGPVGNKYGVYCPAHEWKDVQGSVVGLAKAAAVPEGHRS